MNSIDEDLDIEYFSADEGDEDRESSVGFSPDSRRRTLEPRETIINILGSEMQSSRSGSNKYVVFICEVITGIKTWKQKHRFREFVKLDREIVQLISNSTDPTLKDVWLPILPPKSMTKSSDDPELVRTRCLKLEEYLRNLVELNFIWDLPGGPLAEFLDDESTTLSVLVELSRLRVWRNALAEDKNPGLDSEELQSLRSSLSQVDVELFQRLGNNKRLSSSSSQHFHSSTNITATGTTPTRDHHHQQQSNLTAPSPTRLTLTSPGSKPPPPSTPPPKNRHSVDVQKGLLTPPSCVPTSRPTSSSSSSSSSKHRHQAPKLDAEDMVNRQIKLQQQQQQQYQEATSRNSTNSSSSPPPPPPPLNSKLQRSSSGYSYTSSGRSGSGSTLGCLPSFEAVTPPPLPTDWSSPNQPIVGLRSTISDLRPVPETLQEARELIKRTERSLSGTTWLKTRQLSVTARKSPNSALSRMKRNQQQQQTKLSKISDSSPPVSPELKSQKKIKNNLTSSQNHHHLPKIQIDDEDRFNLGEERLGSQIAKEFEDFNLEKYSEFHRPSEDLKDLITTQELEQEQEEKEQEEGDSFKVEDNDSFPPQDFPVLHSSYSTPTLTLTGNGGNSGGDGGGGGEGGGLVEEQRLIKSESSPHVLNILSATHPLPSTTHNNLNSIIDNFVSTPRPPTATSSSTSNLSGDEMRDLDGFKPLSRMPAVRSQSSEEVNLQALTNKPQHLVHSNHDESQDPFRNNRHNSGHNSEYSSGFFKDATPSEDKEEKPPKPPNLANPVSPVIDIPKTSKSQKQKQPLSSYSHGTSHNGSSFGQQSNTGSSLRSRNNSLRGGNNAGSFGSVKSLPVIPPALPEHDDISAILTLFRKKRKQKIATNREEREEQDEGGGDYDDERESTLPFHFPGIRSSYAASSSNPNPNPNPSIHETDAIWKSGLFASIDELIGWIQPTSPSLVKRRAVFEWVELLVHQALGAKLLAVGSFPQRTYLPESDLDVSAMLLSGQEDSWFVKVNEALCLASLRPVMNPILREMKASTMDAEELAAIPPYFVVRNFSFINGRVKIVKASINDIAVDVSANQAPALYAVILLDTADKFFGQDHLFKRSLLLVKTWAKHESSALSSGWGAVLNSSSGGLSTAALNILVLSLFNRFSDQITHPFHALCLFLMELSTIEFETTVLTMYGPMPISSATEGKATALAAEQQQQLNNQQQPIKSLPYSFILDLSTRVSGIMHALGAKEGETSNTSSFPSSAEPSPSSSSTSSTTGRSTTSSSFFQYYKVGHVNVIDPLHAGNNLAAAVNTGGLGVLRHSSARGLAHIAEIIKELATISAGVHVRISTLHKNGFVHDDNHEMEFDQINQQNKEDEEEDDEGVLLINEFGDSACRSIFPRTWEMYGEGVRPDLRSSNIRVSNYSNVPITTHIYGASSSSSSSSSVTTSALEHFDKEREKRDLEKLRFVGGLSLSSVDTSNTVGDGDGELLVHKNSGGGVGVGYHQEQEQPYDLNSPYARRVHMAARSLLATDSLSSEYAARHAELVLASKVNEDALARLVVGIIETAGPLPVGEVGKQLQEVSGNSSLSTLLKEHFGGLKKFLEKMPNDFIVGDDHPFNPHVSLVYGELYQPPNPNDISLKNSSKISGSSGSGGSGGGMKNKSHNQNGHRNYNNTSQKQYQQNNNNQNNNNHHQNYNQSYHQGHQGESGGGSKYGSGSSGSGSGSGGSGSGISQRSNRKSLSSGNKQNKGNNS